jgi:AAA15 family ATPase/GTPase
MEMEDEVISSISIKNFQAHKETNLTLSPGIAAIIGSSDSGKTSILRSLYWLVQNKPNGVQMVSYWNRKKDGTPKDDTSVSIQINGQTITRIRNSDRNGYDFDGKELSAIGRDVPEEITKALNCSDINIAKQFDQHFLLSESSGEVARRLNEMIHLDLIDETLSKVESLKRECRKEINAKAEAKATLEASLARLQFVPKAMQLLASIKEKEQQKSELSDKAGKLEYLIQTIKDYELILATSKKLLAKMAKLFESLDILLEDKANILRNKHRLENMLDTYSKYERDIAKFDFIRKARRMFALIDSLIEDKNSIGKKMLAIADLMRQVKDLTSIAQEKYLEAEKIEKALPEQCPHCSGTGFLLEKE